MDIFVEIRIISTQGIIYNGNKSTNVAILGEGVLAFRKDWAFIYRYRPITCTYCTCPMGIKKQYPYVLKTRNAAHQKTSIRLKILYTCENLYTETTNVSRYVQDNC